MMRQGDLPEGMDRNWAKPASDPQNVDAYPGKVGEGEGAPVVISNTGHISQGSDDAKMNCTGAVPQETTLKNNQKQVQQKTITNSDFYREWMS